MPEVQVRKTIIILHNFALDGAEWEEQININFVPDEVIVKSISYSSNPDEADYGVGYIWTNLVSDNILGTYIDQAISTPNHNFMLYSPVNGIYQFQGRDVQKGLDVLAQGDLAIVLEFVKYKTDLTPKKIY